jgi:hypothetical protein
MKALIWILILAAIGFAVYYYFFNFTEEEQAVRALEKEFKTAVGDFIRGGRMTATTGIGTDIESAIRKVRQTRKQLTELMPTLQEDKAIEMAEKLKAEIEDFYKKNELD